MNLRKIKNKKAGFSLIEVLVVVFIAAVIFTSFYSVSSIGTRFIIEAKNRLAATALVNERMEIVRNLPYDKVGIQGSVDIPGNLLAFETLNANGRSYDVSMSVRYFDDPMDGTVNSSPVDPIPNDYKIVRVIVSWNDSTGQEKSVSSSSRFVPPGLETSVGGSPLSINVMSDTNGVESPVSGASVHITNNNVSPVIDDIIQTDGDGNIMLPAAMISSGNKLIITKNGYENVQTMDSTSEFTPIYKHVDVIGNSLNQYSFKQNKLSTLHVKTEDYQGNPIANISFSIEGGKIIGYSNDPINPMPTFSMESAVATTDSNGEKTYSNISPGNYDISMNANTSYMFIDSEPAAFPVILPAEADFTYTLKVADQSVPALFLKVNDAVDGAVIADADVSLFDGSDAEIFSSKKTSLRGIVFYPDNSSALVPGQYKLKIEATGYVTKTETININNALTEIVVELARN